MDISTTTAPRSDQQNFDDYLTGPKTLTITEVRAGSDEQPVEVHVAEFPDRPYKPSKSMRRVLLAAWGPDTSVYASRRMELYGDPEVAFGGKPVGGIKIRSLSHIDKPLKIVLTTTRGKRDPFVVQPLVESKPAAKPATDRLAVTLAAVEMASTVEQVRAVWDEHAELLDEADRNRLKDAMVVAKARIQGGAS